MADQACTLADVKTQLRIGVGDTTDDTYLTGLIEDVTDWMQQYTGRYLCPHSFVSFLTDTAAGSVIEVPQGIRSVGTLSIATSNQPDSGGTYSVVSGANIVLRPPELMREPGMPATQVVILGSSAPLRDAINGAKFTGADLGPFATPDRFARIALDAVVAAYQARRAGASGVIGADDTATTPWASYFAYGSPQRQTLMRARAGAGIA